MMLSDVCLSVCLTSVCLSRTSDLSRVQRGLGRLKIGTEVAHVTTRLGHHFQGQNVKVTGAGAYCDGLTHSLFLLYFHGSTFNGAQLPCYASPARPNSNLMY